jgi:hypothetical protein
MGSDISPGQYVTADRLAFVGLSFLAVYGAFVFVPWAFLAVGLSVAGWMVLLALFTAAVSLYLLAENDRIRTVGVSMGIVGAFLLLGIVVALHFFDASVDGRWYHQSAVISLSDGWNPISNADPGIVSGIRFVRSYPKAFWIAAASLHELVGSVEVGKSLHVLPLGAAFFLTVSLLVRLNFRIWLAVAGAGLAAANPIWILESLSFYVDGQIASLLLVAVATGLWIVCFGNNRIAAASLGLCLILLVNLKFTGLFYAGLVLLGLGGALLVQRRWLELRRMIAVNAIVLALAVGVVGFNPYVQNLLDFGNPFYPVYGTGSVDFITGNTPANLRGAPQLVQLSYGIFGKPANPIESNAELAVPFSLSNLSIRFPYTGPGARTAGFGPLFSGALVLSLAGLAWLGLRERRRAARLLVGFTVLFLAATVVAHPEGWWARYTPQLWLIPIVVILGAWAMSSQRAKWMGVVIGVVVAANLVYVVRPYVESNIDYTNDVRRMYQPFVENSEIMAVYINSSVYYASTVAQMEEAGVAFVAYSSVESLPCAAPQRFVKQEGKYCLVGSASDTG